jgi:NADH dehydrogenase
MAFNVLILGGGFAGLTAARRLERKLPPHAAKVTLVNDVNFMLYTPLLPGAAGGTLEPRHVVVPLREELNSTELRIAQVTGADPARRAVTVQSQEGEPEDLHYDQLIVALGSVSRTLPVPGLEEHALGFKTLSEGIALRNRVVWTMEMAENLDDDAERRALLTYVVVGAGYAGLEGLAELQDFASDVIDLYPRCRMTGVRFILVEARDRVMGEIPADLAEYATAELRRRGIEVKTSTMVDSVTAATVELSTGELVPTRRCAGRRASSPTRSSPGSGSRSTAGAGSRRTATARSKATRTSGPWAMRPACRTRPARGIRPRRPPSTRSARRRWPPTTSRGRWAAGGAGRSATGPWASSSTWGATRPSRAPWGSSGAASRPGFWPAPTTW